MERGIIEDDVPGLFFLSSRVARSRRYPAIDGKSVDDVRLRVMRILFEDDVNSDGFQNLLVFHTRNDGTPFEMLPFTGRYIQVLIRTGWSNDTAPAGHTGR